MAPKEDFKKFVKNNSYLIKYVKNNEMTWQKFYELYDLYGEDNEIWNKYKGKKEQASSNQDLLSWIKSIDLDSIQEGVNNLQRVISVFQDLNSNKEIKDDYKPRPLYRHFED